MSQDIAPAGDAAPWRDPSRPVAERVADLLGQMTLEEKAAQLTSIWLGQAGDENVAPMQGEAGGPDASLSELITDGLGQLTRVYGTRPVPPAQAFATLRELQAQVVSASRFGIPAVAHEECLTGFGGASDRLPLRGTFTLAGPERAVGTGRVLDTPAEVGP